MPINESVYGAKENWIVPSNRTELGHQYTGSVYYYNDIASDDKLKIKVANFNTLSNPVTSFRSQMDGEYPNETYAIRNNWAPTQTESIDKSIVMFGIGDQSGLADVEWWGIDWVTGQSEPTSDVDPVIINHDKYDIVNIGFGLVNGYIPPMNYTATGAANTTTGDMLITGIQYINRQIWGDQRCYFNTDSDSFYNYHIASGYAFLNFITQIPIKNLKIYPRITAYKSDTQWKQFNSIQDYLAEKNDYPLLGCIEAMFQYRSGLSNTTDYNSSASITPIFTDKTTVLKGYQNGTDPDKVIRDENLWYCRNWRRHFVVAGRYGYDRSGSYGMMNNIYWVATYNSRPYTYAIFDAVYQTPDFKFALDNNKCFTCDVSSMTDDQITEGIRKQLASFGMFFVDDIDDINLALDDEKTFLGILKNGVGYGDYSNGAKNREQDQWNWDTMEENSYDPSNPPKTDPNTYESTSGFNPAINAPDGFNKRYVLSEIDIRTLREDFFQALESKPEDIDYINYTMSEFLTNNPVDCIVSLKWFPFTVPSHGQEVNINLGNYQTNVHAPVYTGSGVEVYSLGSCVIYPYAGSGEPCFLDYAPYTKMELIIPYCGTVELDPSIYMNHTLSVNFIVDIYTGACTAYIMCDGLVSDSVSGVCCVDLPISGIDNATLEGQIYNASLNLKSSKIGEAVSVVSGGLSFGTSLLGVKGSGAKMAKGVVGTVDALTGAIGSVAQSSESLAMNQYQIEHINIPFRTVGSQTGLGNAKQEQFCRLLIYRPKFINGLTTIRQWYESNEGKLYGHTVGYSCIKTDVISSFHGFTMFSNVDLSGINATDSEKAAILTALQSGVILP